MKPTDADFERTLTTIAATKFFPSSEPNIRLEVLELLRDMVGTGEQMDWLRKTIRDRVSEWPGLAGLRGIFCAFHRPADGVDAVSDLPGFTLADRNARWEERQGREVEESLRLAARAAITDGKEPAPLEPFVLSEKALQWTRTRLPRPDDEVATRDFITRIYGKGIA